MTKPRVFIAMHYMELGGAEAALIGMLRAWDFSRADVDLFIFSHRGELMEYIPVEVNLLPQKRAYSVIESPIRETLAKGCLGVAYGRWRGKREFSRKYAGAWNDSLYTYTGRNVIPHLPMMSRREYDLAISFLTPHWPVIHKVKAHKKMCWIHTDYSSVPLDVDYELPMWGAFDLIASISADVTRGFLSKFPSLEDRIVEIGNIMPVDLIRERSREFVPDEFAPGMFNILTVGRFSHVKNLTKVPGIVKEAMRLSGRDDLVWHLIGYGPQEDAIRHAITENGMDEHVKIIGKRSNPYPYIAACDLYAQPSLFEGKSVTVREAQALGRPVVISDYPTSASQLDDGIDGKIVPLKNFAQGLADIIADTGLRQKLIENCAVRDYSNRSEIDKIYSLLP